MSTLPLADARAQLSKLVTEAENTHERFEITRKGQEERTIEGIALHDQSK